MSGEVRVPVKVWLKSSTYRTLLGSAKAHGLRDVGALVEHLADRAAAPRPSSKRRSYERMTPERVALLQELVAADTPRRQIADRLGVSLSTVHNYTTTQKGKS